VKDPRRDQYLYVEDPKATKFATIVRNENALTADNIAKLKKAGITQVTVYEPGFWDLVCEELCGQGHATMRGQIFVLDSDEYNKKFEGGRSLNPPATRPASNLALAK
jgi:heme/copper-type cytochrome/quinol oxidase subunit 2